MGSNPQGKKHTKGSLSSRSGDVAGGNGTVDRPRVAKPVADEDNPFAMSLMGNPRGPLLAHQQEEEFVRSLPDLPENIRKHFPAAKPLAAPPPDEDCPY